MVIVNYEDYRSFARVVGQFSFLVLSCFAFLATLRDAFRGIFTQRREDRKVKANISTSLRRKLTALANAQASALSLPYDRAERDHQ